MEIGNNGIIGLYDSSLNVQRMKEYYEEEYKKIEKEENLTEKKYKRNKWKVRFGTALCHLGFNFTPKKYRFLGKLGIDIGGLIAQRSLYKKNKKAKKEFQEQKDKLTADFINAEGIFTEFNVNDMDFSIEEIKDLEPIEQSFSK